jgi:hypothetical protein
MIAQMRKDGILHIKMHGGDAYRVMDVTVHGYGVEIFLDPGQVDDLRKEISGSSDVLEKVILGNEK